MITWRSRFMVLMLASSLSAPALAVTMEEVVLTSQEVAPTCKMIDARKPARSESEVFYDHTVNSDMLPLMFKKAAQGFQCGHDKGVVYYFEYSDAAKREKVELEARSHLWGEDTQANPKHPEQIFHWDRFLIIMSFKTLQRDVLGALIKKLKHFDKPA